MRRRIVGDGQFPAVMIRCQGQTQAYVRRQTLTRVGGNHDVRRTGDRRRLGGEDRDGEDLFRAGVQPAAIGATVVVKLHAHQGHAIGIGRRRKGQRARRTHRRFNREQTAVVVGHDEIHRLRRLFRRTGVDTGSPSDDRQRAGARQEVLIRAGDEAGRVVHGCHANVSRLIAAGLTSVIAHRERDGARGGGWILAGVCVGHAAQGVLVVRRRSRSAQRQDIGTVEGGNAVLRVGVQGQHIFAADEPGRDADRGVGQVAVIRQRERAADGRGRLVLCVIQRRVFHAGQVRPQVGTAAKVLLARNVELDAVNRSRIAAAGVGDFQHPSAEQRLAIEIGQPLSGFIAARERGGAAGNWRAGSVVKDGERAGTIGGPAAVVVARRAPLAGQCDCGPIRMEEREHQIRVVSVVQPDANVDIGDRAAIRNGYRHEYCIRVVVRNCQRNAPTAVARRSQGPQPERVADRAQNRAAVLKLQHGGADAAAGAVGGEGERADDYPAGRAEVAVGLRGAGSRHAVGFQQSGHQIGGAAPPIGQGKIDGDNFTRIHHAIGRRTPFRRQGGTDHRQGWQGGDELQSRLRHDDASAGSAIITEGFDVERGVGERGADLGGGQSVVLGLEQRGDGGGVRGGGGGAVEWIETGHASFHAVSGGDIRLLAYRAAGGTVISRRDGAAIGLIEDAARSVGSERLRRVRHSARERPRVRRQRAGGRHAVGIGGTFVAVGVPRRVKGQPAAAGFQMQETVRATGLHDDHPFPHVQRPHGFIRVLRAVLRRGRTAEHAGAGRIQNIQVIIVGRGAKRVRPEQVQARIGAVHRHHGVVGPTSEVVENAAFAGEQRTRRTPVQKITLPRPRSPVVQVPGITRGRKIECAPGRHRVDRLGDDAVLKWRLVEIADVVHKDVAPSRAEGQDVIGKVGRPAKRGGKIKRRPWSQVVNDFQQGRPLTDAAAGLTGQHRDNAQIAGSLRIGEVVNTVREHTHLNARARHAEIRPRGHGGVRGVPFRGQTPGARRTFVRRTDE